MNYLVKSMKNLNLKAKDIEESLPCSLDLLTSENPFYIEGTSILDSEVNCARKIP